MDSIIFVGPRGVGKSKAGETVAYRAGLPFVDADDVFVSRDGGISEFVRENGWPEFRRLEAQTLDEICAAHSASRIVLATGGGAVAHDQGDVYRQHNVDLLMAFGTVFYLLPYENLKMSARILVARIYGDASSASMRPALTAESDPLTEMLTQLTKRDELYRKAAHHVILTGDKSPKGIADLVSARIREESAPMPLQTQYLLAV